MKVNNLQKPISKQLGGFEPPRKFEEVSQMFKVAIPEISDEELIRRYQQIKPIISVEGRLHYLREYSFEELTNSCYLWNIDNDIRDKVGKNELEIMRGKDFPCLHPIGDCAFFRPTIKEILAQIKESDIHLVKAFEIIKEPPSAINIYKDKFNLIAFDNGYHVSFVRLYKKKK